MLEGLGGSYVDVVFDAPVKVDFGAARIFDRAAVDDAAPFVGWYVERVGSRFPVAGAIWLKYLDPENAPFQVVVPTHIPANETIPPGHYRFLLVAPEGEPATIRIPTANVRLRLRATEPGEVQTVVDEMVLTPVLPTGVHAAPLTVAEHTSVLMGTVLTMRNGLPPPADQQTWNVRMCLLGRTKKPAVGLCDGNPTGGGWSTGGGDFSGGTAVQYGAHELGAGDFVAKWRTTAVTQEARRARVLLIAYRAG